MITHTPAPTPKGSLLPTGQILALERRSNMTDDEALRFARAVESAVLSELRAPVAEIHVGVSATGRGATICIMQPHADGSITTIYSATHPLGDSMGRAALSAQPAQKEQSDA